MGRHSRLCLFAQPAGCPADGTMAGRTRAHLKRLEEEANARGEDEVERPAKEPKAEEQEAQALQPDADDDARAGRSRSRSVSRSRSRSRSPPAARSRYSETRGYSTWVSQETVVEPAADAAPAGAAARHPQQVNNGNPYQRISATLTAFEKQLAEERARLPAGSYYQYYQSLAAPATTQGYVQQQPLWNPTLLRWQQELDEQARALGARFP